MATDKNGVELKVLDEVTIRARVAQLRPGDDHSNVILETVEPLHPSELPVIFAVNGKQVEKPSPDAPVAPAVSVRPPAAPADVRVLEPHTDATVPDDVIALLQPVSQKQLAAQGNTLLPGQYIDRGFGVLYFPMSDEEVAAVSAGTKDPAWSYNTMLKVRAAFRQNSDTVPAEFKPTPPVL